MTKILKIVLTPIVCLALLALAIFGAATFVKTAPEAKKKRPPKTSALVKTQPLVATNLTVVLELAGTVVPAEEIRLRARVSGEIVFMAPRFVDGGLLDKGADVVRIDPIDYELALASTESALERARFEYKLELGRQDVARREWDLIDSGDATEQEKELGLRVPHLAASKAALKAAEAALEKARLDLSRTTVRAPFDALVLERGVNMGSQASQQDTLARLAGTAAYWVEVSIPVDRLGWVDIPGSRARIISSAGGDREGRVIERLGDLEEKGRMARLLVEVQDPLCRTPGNQGKHALLLGEYVRAEIDGRELKGVYAIPRSALRDNQHIWVAADGKLDIREVEVAWRGADDVLVRNGITDGEMLIVSDLTAPIQGMDINTGGPPKQGRPEKQAAEKE